MRNALDVTPPAQIASYVDVLGQDLAVQFILAFGGAEIYIPRDPQNRSRVAAVIGQEMTARLAQRADQLPRRVPTAKPWLAAVMRAQGMPVAEIARRLHVTDVTVRAMLKRTAASGDPRQMTLF